MNLQVGVKAILKNSEGKILLLKRSKEKYPDVKNPWDIVGGRITPGMNLIENLKREISEETGFELQTAPILVGAQDIMRPEKHVVRLTFTALAEGEPKLSDEHTEFAWLAPEELKHKEGLDDFLKNLITEQEIL